MTANEENFGTYNQSGKLLPQEEILEVKKRKRNLVIGVPKETFFLENRIALVPDSVALLVQNGHKVIIESDAGKAAHFFNKDYSESGAQVVYDTREVYRADILLKVAPPSTEEIGMLKSRQTIISTLQFTAQNKAYFKELMAKKMTAIAFEFIKDKVESYPIVRSMSEIAGNTSILVAAEYLCNPDYGKGKMFGGISGVTPIEVIIIGAGTVGEYAARAAMGLGANVKIFDNSIYKLRRLQGNIGTRLFTSIVQPKILTKCLKNADVVIGAIHSPGGRSPIIITEEMVKQMKYGSVIVDVSIDQGGCVETSQVTNHTVPAFQKYGVTHYCVPNIASRVAQTASYALSNFFEPILLNVGEEGSTENVLKNLPGLRKGAYLYNGIVTSKTVGDYFDLPYQDIDLLMAAFH
jgi:alanine dehydrogenase